MEADEKENTEVELIDLTVDLSKQSVKKIDKPSTYQSEAVSLILDNNEIQRLENIDLYTNLQKLSISNNQLMRTYGISQLTNLTFLDFSNNLIVTIEGLKDLKQLRHLNLSGNKVKTIDHLNSNLELEYLNLSENIITHISDVSYLINLKELYLHNNRIAHLRQCEKNLPTNLEILTLNNNAITDLNEASHLVQLTSLKELSFNNNPCLESSSNKICFNYRPYLKNWCSSIVVLDGYPLDDIECLKAEWLYSQGRGRSFRAGEHAALVEYLSSVCPKTGEKSVENEDERKLRLILSKAQQHQQQLREQGPGPIPSPSRHKLPLNKKRASGLAERMVLSYHDSVSRDSSRNSPDLMTRSLDATVLMRNSPPPQQPVHHNNVADYMCQSPLQTATTLVPVPESLTSPDVCRPLHPLLHTTNIQRGPHPLATSSTNRTSCSSSRNSPFSTPESKRKATNVLRRQNFNSSPEPSKKLVSTSSPKFGRAAANVTPSPKKTPLGGRNNLRKSYSNDKETSEEEDSEMSASKLQSIQQRASQKRHKKTVVDNRHVEKVRDQEEKENMEENKGVEVQSKDSDIWKAALCIQRRWRGYRTRNLNTEVVTAYRDIRANRIHDYIIKVANDMEATRVALEGNRKLQVLQMQAINALWKKMATLQPNEEAGTSNDSKDTLQGLAQACLSLNKQVEELQSMMKVMHHSQPCDSVPIATQTEIVAVHTPQEGKVGFPYHQRLERPSNLLITQSAPPPVEQYATTLVSDVMKTVSSTGSGTDSCSDLHDLVMELDDNSNVKEASPKAESVCLTPACQEGRDLQATLQPSKPEKSVADSANLESEVASSSRQTDDDNENENDHDILSSQSKDSSHNSPERREYQNGCPSS